MFKRGKRARLIVLRDFMLRASRRRCRKGALAPSIHETGKGGVAARKKKLKPILPQAQNHAVTGGGRAVLKPNSRQANDPRKAKAFDIHPSATLVDASIRDLEPILIKNKNVLPTLPQRRRDQHEQAEHQLRECK